MKRPAPLVARSLVLAIHLALCSTAISAQSPPPTNVPAVAPADVWVYVYRDQRLLPDVPVSIDGKLIGSTSVEGVVGSRLAAGEHRLSVTPPEQPAAEFPLAVEAGEQVQVQVSYAGARGLVVVLRSSTRGERTLDLTPAAEPAPAAGAEDSALPMVLRGIEVVGGAERSDDRAAYTEERRASAQINEALSSAQISAAGDSDTAQALKRVTGLSLVDGKYIYVRGLGERYSSVLFNNAQIPSPDPSRRVVPLDLFPTEILDGIIVQKSYSADLPAEFGGGTVRLRTKAIPDDFFFKLSLGTGYSHGTTFEDGLRYRGGDRDWTGFDDSRELPDSIRAANARFGRLLVQTPFSPGLTPEEIQMIGRDVAAQGFTITTSNLGPSSTVTASIGDSFTFGDDWRFGYVGSLRHAHAWDNTSETRRDFGIGSDNVVIPVAELERERTERQIDLSGFLNLGLEFGPDHRLASTTTLVRQSTDTARIDEGYNEGPEDISRYFLLEWEENALLVQQLLGQHHFEDWSGLTLDWSYTDSSASRDAPNTREYRYDRFGGPGSDDFRFTTRSDANAISFAELEDEAKNYGFDLTLPLSLAGDNQLTLLTGASRVDRDRDSELRRYSFAGRPPPGSDPDLRALPLDRILDPANIRPDGFFIREVSRDSDAYIATQELDAQYVSLDWQWRERLRVIAGARRERNQQDVVTFNLIDPTQIDGAAAIDTADVLPSLSSTLFINENSQLRAMLSETVSRPDFRELSTSPFIDPLIDTISVGNPGLLPTDTRNYDLRYEYYFSPSEVASAALFRKTFRNPIERIQAPGTGEIVTYFNVPEATLYGIELDVYKYLDFLQGDDESWMPWDQVAVGLNYAYIKSEVNLTPATAGVATTLSRPLQGQSPYVLNFQLGWQDEEGTREGTLLYNVAGSRISEVGAFGVPDVYEQPFDQLDFTYSQQLGEDWRFKLRLRNLLDPKAEFTQGAGITREFRRGRELLLTLEWSP